MRVRFWGVRGSIPAPGPETNRYGGNTSCVSIRLAGNPAGAAAVDEGGDEGGDEAGELIVLDMGTGVMKLGEQLMSGDFGRGQGVASLLLSHAHWDHIQGFGFFAPIFVPGNQFTLYGHASSPARLEGILEGQMNAHYSPIHTVKNLGASVLFESVTPGQPFQVGAASVRALPNPHGTTTALAFRVEHGGRSLVYASDVGYPPDGPSEDMLDLYRGADVLIHDCTYTPADRAARMARGFSSYADAAAAAVAAQVDHLVMFHYDQDYGDDKVDQLHSDCRDELDRLGGRHIALTAAREGLELSV